MSLEPRTYAGTAQDLADAIRTALGKATLAAYEKYNSSESAARAWCELGELTMDAVDTFEVKL